MRGDVNFRDPANRPCLEERVRAVPFEGPHCGASLLRQPLWDSEKSAG